MVVQIDVIGEDEKLQQSNKPRLRTCRVPSVRSLAQYSDITKWCGTMLQKPLLFYSNALSCNSSYQRCLSVILARWSLSGRVLCKRCEALTHLVAFITAPITVEAHFICLSVNDPNYVFNNGHAGSYRTTFRASLVKAYGVHVVANYCFFNNWRKILTFAGILNLGMLYALT